MKKYAEIIIFMMMITSALAYYLVTHGWLLLNLTAVHCTHWRTKIDRKWDKQFHPSYLIQQNEPSKVLKKLVKHAYMKVAKVKAMETICAISKFLKGNFYTDAAIQTLLLLTWSG